MVEHRVPLLGERWRRFEEPQSSRDPRIRALVGQLQDLGGGPAPDPVFRAELRAQLVAITPRIVSEGAEADIIGEARPARAAAAPTSSAPAHAPSRRRFRPGRVLGVATSLIVAFMLIIGGAAALSRKAIPGDTLYGLKRAGERVELATDGSDSERAGDLLGFATTRVDEVQKLINRSSATASGPGYHAGAISGSTASLIRSTLASANSDTADASRLLSNQAVHDRSATVLTGMKKWAPGQLTRLTAVWSSLPEGSLRTMTSGSKRLVSRAQARARALTTSVDCTCMTAPTSDNLGPKPCTDCSTPVTATPARHAKSGGANSATDRNRAPVSSGSSVTPVKGSTVTTSPNPGLGKVSTPTPSGRVTPTSPTLPSLPPLPITLPTKPVVPISTSSCGIKINLLGIKVSLGTCHAEPTP